VNRGTPLYTYDAAYEEFKPTLWKHNIGERCRSLLSPFAIEFSISPSNIIGSFLLTRVCHFSHLFADLGCTDASQGITLSPMVDTDALNTNIALLGLHLLHKHHPATFPTLSLDSETTRVALDSRPPCRWEEHTYRVPAAADSEKGAQQGSAATEEDTTGSEATASGSFTVPSREVECREVQVVLDMGHNPAAMGALARRIAHKFQGRNVR